MHWDWSQQNLIADEEELRDKIKSLLPWINYELWSNIEKGKEAKSRYQAQRKSEYLDLLRQQGIDVTKINMADIVFAEDEEEAEDEGESMEVIE